MRTTNSILICVLWILIAAVGCGSAPSKSSHTHLWTADRKQHVWSYERVATAVVNGREETEPQGFVQRELKPGESLTLDGGAVVSYDGSKLRVGKQLINAANVHVERDGSIRLNAFIRASD